MSSYRTFSDEGIYRHSKMYAQSRSSEVMASLPTRPQTIFWNKMKVTRFPSWAYEICSNSSSFLELKTSMNFFRVACSLSSWYIVGHEEIAISLPMTSWRFIFFFGLNSMYSSVSLPSSFSVCSSTRNLASFWAWKSGRRSFSHRIWVRSAMVTFLCTFTSRPKSSTSIWSRFSLLICYSRPSLSKALYITGSLRCTNMVCASASGLDIDILF